MPKIDNLLMFRCVQVMRRLQLKNRDIGLFCNVSAATLTDAAFFQQLLDFMDANRALAPSMVLEFTPGRLSRASARSRTRAWRRLPNSASVSRWITSTDLRMEPQANWPTAAFRFVKVPAKLLLNRAAGAHERHPSRPISPTCWRASAST